MELDVYEEKTRPLVGPTEKVAAPLPDPISGKNERMKKPIAIAITIAVVLFLVTVITVITVIVTKSEDHLEVGVAVPWKVTVTLRSKSNTARGVGGQLQLCSQGKGCCLTDRFVFTAPTVIYLEDHQNCRNFEMDKSQEMSIKVLNEDEVKILIYRFEVVLDDGASYHVLYQKSATNSPWSQPLPLKLRDITNDQKILMKINIRNLEGNPSEALYVKDSRIEIKLSGDSRIGCKTNPLPWPTKEGTVNLNDIESLGTCFTYSIIEARENLLVRYREPSNAPFTVSKVVLKTFENQNYGWTVRQPTGQWSNAEFDDDY